MLKGAPRIKRAASPAADADGVQALLALARASFVRLQAAWDVADEQTLSSITTEPLMADLRQQLRQRPPGPHHTEVLSVEAQLLALDELRGAYVASVEFTGLIREQRGAQATRFREMWLLASAKGGDAQARADAVRHSDGWRLAAVQALS